MSLCRPTRCGCTITSSTLQVTSKVGGGGFNIESYEGVATEVPDTRPGPSDRFEGMRVWTSDTKREFVWNDTLAKWEILSEPVQFDLVEADFLISQSASKTAIPKRLLTAWYQRQRNHFELFASFEMLGSGTAGQPVIVKVPTSKFSWGSAYNINGPASVYRGAANKAYPAVVGAGGGPSSGEILFYVAEDGGNLELSVDPLAYYDTLGFKITGPLV